MAAPNPIQRLKHGVLLCKTNFGTFVETFNYLVDFVQNLRGDGDNSISGSIVVDRTIPDRPIIRSKINTESIESEAQQLPWQFVNGTGWKNCRLQIGYNYYSVSPDLPITDSLFVSTIANTNLTSDGEHWVEVDVAQRTATIRLRTSDSDWSAASPNDPANNIVRVRVGNVENGELTYGLHCNPVIYSYLDQ